MSNVVMMEQIVGSRIPNLKAHVVCFHLVSRLKRKNKKGKKEEKSPMPEIFSHGKLFMATATVL